jgi:hypothetical protein
MAQYPINIDQVVALLVAIASVLTALRRLREREVFARPKSRF